MRNFLCACQRPRDSILSLEQETGMNGNICRWIGRLGGKAIVCFAAILLVFPTSVCVLCIAPGIHIAIEDLSAACCAYSAVYAHDSCLPGNGFDIGSSCGNCTDILVLENDRGAIPKSDDGAAWRSITAACFGDSLSVSTSPQLFRRSMRNDVVASPPASSSIPLRC